MKTFDILLNKNCSVGNPIRVSIITKIDTKFVYCIALNKPKSKHVQVKYSRSDVLNSDSFEIIGHSDILNFIKTELEKYE